MFGLKQGNAALAEIHKEMNIESVERLLEETQEAQAYQRVRATRTPLWATKLTSFAGDRRNAYESDDCRRGGGRSTRTRRAPSTRMLFFCDDVALTLRPHSNNQCRRSHCPLRHPRNLSFRVGQISTCYRHTDALPFSETEDPVASEVGNSESVRTRERTAIPA